MLIVKVLLKLILFKLYLPERNILRWKEAAAFEITGFLFDSSSEPRMKFIAIAVILCLAAVAITILSLRYEKNLGKVADKQSYVHNALHYQKLFVNPGSLLIAAIGIYWSVERIFL